MFDWLFRKLGWDEKMRQQLKQLQAEKEELDRRHRLRKLFLKTLSKRKK
jgi:hypothetical protein